MAIKLSNGKYKCMFCEYTNSVGADVDGHTEREHDYFLVPLLREDLARLMQFIYVKDDALITERLYKTLQKYNNSKPKPPKPVDEY